MKGQGYQTVPGSLFIAYLLKEGILTAYQSCSKIDTYQKNLKFDTKHNGKPVKSRVLAYVRSEPLISLGLRGFGKTLYTTFTQVSALFFISLHCKGLQAAACFQTIHLD